MKNRSRFFFLFLGVVALFLASCSSARQPRLGEINLGDSFMVRGFADGNVDNQTPLTSRDGKVFLSYGRRCLINQEKNSALVIGMSGNEMLLFYITDDTVSEHYTAAEGDPPCVTGVLFVVTQEKYLQMKERSETAEKKNGK